MKNLSILILALFSTLIQLSGQVTAVPDSFFEQQLIWRGLDTGRVNGFVPNEFIENVTEFKLNVYFPSHRIRSIKGIEGFKNLKKLDVETNHGELRRDFFDISGLVNLEELNVNSSEYRIIDLSKNKKLKTISLGGRFGATIDSLDLSNNTELQYLSLDGTNLIYLDLSNNSSLQIVGLSGNSLLEKLNLKNCASQTLSFSNNPKLSMVCVDENEQESVQFYLDQFSPHSFASPYCLSQQKNCVKNKYEVHTFIDDGNGCSLNSRVLEQIKYSVNNMVSGNSYKTSYPLFLDRGKEYLIKPIFPPSSVVQLSPSEFLVKSDTFIDSTKHLIFCADLTNVPVDKEVQILPLSIPRPGSLLRYKLIGKNLSADSTDLRINFFFQDSIMDYVAYISKSSVAFNVSNNMISITKSDLKPFESYECIVTFKLNSPTMNPPVNLGDLIISSATCDSFPSEINYINNFSQVRQRVVNSYDPNRVVCMEGEKIKKEDKGKKLNYVIMFENEGNAEAENIYITGRLSTTLFDFDDIEIINSSHPCYLKLGENNELRFYFENIDLSHIDSINDGHVSFSIRTLDNVLDSDSFKALADIYFDFNKPIRTNTYFTSFSSISSINTTTKSGLKIYPNPTSSILNIEIKGDLGSKYSIFDIYGSNVQKGQLSKTVPVSSLIEGTYLLTYELEGVSYSFRFLKSK